MTQLQLIQFISAPNAIIGVERLSNQLKKQNFSLKDLVDLTFHADKLIAKRASKLLEYMLFTFPKDYYMDIDYLIDHSGKVVSPSIVKNYARVLMYITSPEMPRKVRDKIKETGFENTIETCFIWLSDPYMLTGARASAAEALFNLRHRYPWIAETLSIQLELLMSDATPMLLAKGNYILSFLHCED